MSKRENDDKELPILTDVVELRAAAGATGAHRALAVPAEEGWMITDEIPEPAPTADPPVTRQVALITAHPDV